MNPVARIDTLFVAVGAVSCSAAAFCSHETEAERFLVYCGGIWESRVGGSCFFDFQAYVEIRTYFLLVVLLQSQRRYVRDQILTWTNLFSLAYFDVLSVRWLFLLLLLSVVVALIWIVVPIPTLLDGVPLVAVVGCGMLFGLRLGLQHLRK